MMICSIHVLSNLLPLNRPHLLMCIVFMSEGNNGALMRTNGQVLGSCSMALVRKADSIVTGWDWVVTIGIRADPLRGP